MLLAADPPALRGSGLDPPRGARSPRLRTLWTSAGAGDAGARGNPRRGEFFGERRRGGLVEGGGGDGTGQRSAWSVSGRE